MKKLYASMLAMTIAGAAFAQNDVSTGTVKYVMLEEGTGTWCQFCPDGQVKMLEILGNSSNQNRVNAVALHNGDAMAIADANTVLNAYTPSWPNGGVDRVLNTMVSPNKVFMSRSYWQTFVTQQLAVAPSFQIDLAHSFDSVSKAMSITVKVKTLVAQTGNYNINAYIVEDSVTGTGSGYNQINAYNTVAGHEFYQAGDPIVGFVHRHVARAMLGGPWGTTGVITANPAANSTFSKSYTYTLPSTANYKRYKVIAFVTRHDASVPNNRIVMNSVEAHVTHGNALAIANVNEDVTNLAVYPNPATDNVFVTGVLSEPSDVNISIVNTVGQVVAQKAYTNLNNKFDAAIETAALTSGLYYITVTTNGTKKTERLMIAK